MLLQFPVNARIRASTKKNNVEFAALKAMIPVLRQKYTHTITTHCVLNYGSVQSHQFCFLKYRGRIFFWVMEDGSMITYKQGFTKTLRHRGVGLTYNNMYCVNSPYLYSILLL